MIEYVKLRCGDELIGEIREEHSENTLFNPWRMILTPSGYAPCPIPANEVSIDASEIVFRGEVDSNLSAIYREKTGMIVTRQNLVIPRC